MHAFIHSSSQPASQPASHWTLFLVALIRVFFHKGGVLSKIIDPKSAQDAQQTDSKATKNREEIDQKSCQNQRKIDEKSTRNGPRRPQEQLWSNRRAKKSKKEAKKSISGAPRGRPGDPKFIEKRIKKTMKKRRPQKSFFFSRIFCFFKFSKVVFFVFLAILGPPWWSFLVIFLASPFSSIFFEDFSNLLKKWKSKNCSKHCACA